MDEEYKGLLGKLLRLHPDFYSMWNFRKEAVLQEVGRSSLNKVIPNGQGNNTACLCGVCDSLASGAAPPGLLFCFR